MSESALKKLEKDIEKLGEELNVYNSSKGLNETAGSVVSFITTQPEPFQSRTDVSPWLNGDGGGCVIQ